MRNLKANVLGASMSVVSLVAVGLGVVSCIASTSGITQSTQGCPELQEGATIDANVQVDVRVRALMKASIDLRTVRNDLRGAVKDACSKIAVDLGASDTWSALGDADDAIGNGNGTGACDAARVKIVAIMESDAGKAANFALIKSTGECHT